jgi:carbon storage regulator
MLVLTRRIGEEILIGDDIRVTVVAVQGGKVRLGVAAPDSVRVDRREVRERVSRFKGASEGRAPLAARCASARA